MFGDKSFSDLKGEYFASVRGMARDIAANIEAGEVEDIGELDNAIDSVCDGAYWSSHVPAACAALWVSSNGDRFWMENGDTSEFSPCSWVYYTLRADLYDELAAQGYDIHENPRPLDSDDDEGE